MISIQGLYETHLTVTDLERSIDFYRDIVGLELAHTIPERNVAFFWIGSRETSMLGLWSIQSTPLQMKLHIAFQTTLDQVIAAPAYLRSKGITPQSGLARKSTNPSSSRGCQPPASTSMTPTATNWNISQFCKNQHGQTFRA